MPVAVGAGLLIALMARWGLRDQGLAADPAPSWMWFWIGVAGAAVVSAAVGWARVGGGTRTLSVLGVVLALVCAGVQVNIWVGYFPTVDEAWGQLTAAPLPDQIDANRLDALRGTNVTTGKVVAITTPDDVSHFAHRTEYIYLPPAWFALDRPNLPALMMIGGEFSTPTDWIRTGNAIRTLDDYARAHGGGAPVVVFADSTGSFRNDTECVDGPRGNAAEHLTEELRPYVVSHFDTGASARDWGVVGWSTGGTCAVDLGVTHPELFGTFEDIQGDLSPNAGDKQQTITSLYGGDAQAWAAFDPGTVLAHHAPFTDSAGWFDNAPSPKVTATQAAATPGAASGQAGSTTGGTLAGFGGRKDAAPASMRGQQGAEAATLCVEATARNVHCELHTQPGKHTWQFATRAFATALPWLAEHLTSTTGTPTALAARAPGGPSAS